MDIHYLKDGDVFCLYGTVVSVRVTPNIEDVTCPTCLHGLGMLDGEGSVVGDALFYDGDMVSAA